MDTKNVFMLIVEIVLSAAVGGAVLIAYWRVFEKMGLPGWMSLIPFLNQFMEFRLIWNIKAALTVNLLSVSAILFLLLAIGSENGSSRMVGLTLAMAAMVLLVQVLMIFERIRLAEGFGKHTVFGLGLAFFPVIFLMILGFGNAKFKKKEQHKPPKDDLTPWAL